MVTHGLAAELVAVVPWDDERAGIASSFTDHPSYSWHVPEHARKVRSAVRLRLDGAGGFHLLGDAPSVLHLDHAGRPTGRTPLPGRTRDFACTVAGCVQIEEVDGGANRLRAVAAGGSERWSLDGPFAKVLPHREHLYALGSQGILEVEASHGEILRVLPQRGGEPFLGGGHLVSVHVDEETELRGIAVTDPATGETVVHRGNDELYPWLVYPFGADGRSRLYVWRDGWIARVSPPGDIEVLGAVDGIALHDGSVYTSHGSGDHVVVRGDGREVALAAPGFRLVAADASGRFHLLGGEGPGSAGELRVYSPSGDLQSAGPPPDDLAAIDCRMPVHTAWQVDAQGLVTIPVVTPHGVAIVRLGA